MSLQRQFDWAQTARQFIFSTSTETPFVFEQINGSALVVFCEKPHRVFCLFGPGEWPNANVDWCSASTEKHQDLQREVSADKVNLCINEHFHLSWQDKHNRLSVFLYSTSKQIKSIGNWTSSRKCFFLQSKRVKSGDISRRAERHFGFIVGWLNRTTTDFTSVVVRSNDKKPVWQVNNEISRFETLPKDLRRSDEKLLLTRKSTEKGNEVPTNSLLSLSHKSTTHNG